MRLLLVALLVLPACVVTTLDRWNAAQDFHCPRNQLHVEKSDDGNASRVTGCGRDAVYVAGRSPLARASYDLGCPVTDLKMTYLGSNSVGVEGCAKRASYSWVRGQDDDGTWVGAVR